MKNDGQAMAEKEARQLPEISLTDLTAKHEFCVRIAIPDDDGEPLTVLYLKELLIASTIGVWIGDRILIEFPVRALGASAGESGSHEFQAQVSQGDRTRQVRLVVEGGHAKPL